MQIVDAIQEISMAEGGSNGSTTDLLNSVWLSEEYKDVLRLQETIRYKLILYISIHNSILFIYIIVCLEM